jgi:hypothetical protein
MTRREKTRRGREALRAGAWEDLTRHESKEIQLSPFVYGRSDARQKCSSILPLSRTYISDKKQSDLHIK